MRTAEGHSSTTPEGNLGVPSGAPARVLVSDGEVSLARLLRMGSIAQAAGAREASVVTRAMSVVMMGVVIALVVLALGGLR